MIVNLSVNVLYPWKLPPDTVGSINIEWILSLSIWYEGKEFAATYASVFVLSVLFLSTLYVLPISVKIWFWPPMMGTILLVALLCTLLTS